MHTRLMGKILKQNFRIIENETSSVGTVAFDAIETPFGKTDKILGGAATYIGLAASVLDTDVHLVSVVGGDFPDEYLDMMKGKISM